MEGVLLPVPWIWMYEVGEETERWTIGGNLCCCCCGRGGGREGGRETEQNEGGGGGRKGRTRGKGGMDWGDRE